MAIRDWFDMSRTAIGRWVLAASAMLAVAGAAHAAELVVMQQPGCAWCARFEAEIAPAYPNSEEGRRAPLRRVDITGQWPADLAAVPIERFTPTFVLVDRGAEVARLRGYPGDQFFWFRIDDMLKKLPATAGKEGG